MNMSEVTIAYGMTETSPVSTQTSVHDSLEHRVSTVGRVHPHVEIKIVDPETAEIVPRGEAGELQTRGYSVMLGYWNDPERTAEAVDGDGWMHTGDQATMDADGYVNIVGRIKDMIIRGGENIYPREIEEFLYTHPDIVEVQVIGVPDEKYGEEIMAWVQLREGSELATLAAATGTGAGRNEAVTEAVREFCRGTIAHYKVPRYVRVSDEFPMTVTGKIRKVAMRETSIGELGLEQAAAVKNA
jgi:fatty-acyl-CoA synthase